MSANLCDPAWLTRRRIVVLAGPGLLACAGLTPPGERGGLWDRFDPARCATPEALRRHPEQAWRAFRAWRQQVLGAALRPEGPSPAHRALARLTRAGRVRGIITTTTDGLWRSAGISPVAELFGASDVLRCEDCRARTTLAADAPLPPGAPPRCQACGGPLRPAMVLFGEAMPRGPRELAASWVYGGHALLVLGADLTRPPLHRIPEEMFQEGGAILALGDVAPGALRRVRGQHLPGDINELLPSCLEGLPED